MIRTIDSSSSLSPTPAWWNESLVMVLPHVSLNGVADSVPMTRPAWAIGGSGRLLTTWQVKKASISSMNWRRTVSLQFEVKKSAS
jgi:hypothetical protein